MAKIVSFVDASVYADSVCDHAGWVAGLLEAEIELVHVLDRRDMSANQSNLSGALDVNARDILLAELSESDEAAAKLSQKRGRVILEAAKVRLSDNGVDGVTTKLRIGELVETMHELEDEADLFVIGKRGEAADFARLHLGSNIERVVRASTKPILIAARAFRPVSKVLIAYDGGNSIQRAIAYLLRNHTVFSGLKFELLRAGDLRDSESSQLERTHKALRDAGYDAEMKIEQGQPEVVIANAVQQNSFDLLVMGAYGHSRIRTLIIGSTTTEMIRSCKIPILLFR